MGGLDSLAKKYRFHNSILTKEKPNNICYVKNATPVQILGFSNDNGGILLGQRLMNIKSFYKEPCDSISLGIFCVDIEPSQNVEHFPLADIECKAVGFPHMNQILLLPILHGCH